GIVLSKKVYEIPEGIRVNRGRNLANFINIPNGEKVTDVICIPKNINIHSKNVLFATEKGLIKKTKLSEYQRINQTGLKAIKISSDDSLIRVRITNGSNDILLCSTGGKIIRFDEESVRLVGRVSRGVKGMGIKSDEKVITMEIIDDSMELLSMTENGHGKRSLVREYRKQTRGGMGVSAMKLTQKNGKIKAIKTVEKQDDLMVITNKGQVIRTNISEISLQGRNTQGVRIIRLKKDEKVVAVEKIAKEDE
ncbi:MAG: DNA gyrase subunit A, partial [Halobacteriovoraceae bacterium]|nr:DNA gyrase subunit A [Halobacteriovoraceae bacterium]